MAESTEPSIEAIRAEYDQLRAHLPTALVEIAFPSTRVTYMNAVARALLGYDESDVAGGISGLALLQPDSRQRIVEIGAAQLTGTVAVGRPYTRQKDQGIFEFGCLRKNGTPFPAEVQSAYILDGSDYPVGVRFILMDITERRQRDEDRRRLEMQSRQSQKLESLGELAGGIAHDFNNLLTAILGNLHLLRTEIGDRPDALDLIDQATNAAARGATLVRGLLDFARPEVDRWEHTDLGALIRETASLVRPLLTTATQLIVEPLPERRVAVGNPNALEQVLVNLIVNARDALPDGGTITVSLSQKAIQPEDGWTPPDLMRGTYHVLSVSDTGTGIAPEVQERIFDPFFSTKARGTGTGLGLSISLSIARSHGGWLSVESQPGAGSTFRFFLPAEAAAASEELAA